MLLGSVALAFGIHAEAPRVVSLNPSVTQTLLALDAEALLVGVDEYSAQLEPSFVALVPSAQQRSLRARLEALDIEVLALSNHSRDEVLLSIETLGERIGRKPAARARVEEILAAWRDSERRSDSAPRVAAVLVLQRDPLYVVGGGSYLDAMLHAAGAVNAASGFDEAYPRVSLEWLIDAAPELILDAADPPEGAAQYWSRWPSLPAVAGGRVRVVEKQVTLPGPYLDRALEQLEMQVRGAQAELSP
jgi:iron complex transport system substrate-binding protein